MDELNPFLISQIQLDKAAEIMNLDKAAHAILREPMRTVEMQIPVKMRDNSTKLFTGFRVLYNNARGPGKGGIRFHPQENINTVKALSAWMTWKTALANIPYGGSKGGVVCDTKQMNDIELENLSRQYIRSFGSLLGPKTDIPAPDVYTTPQIMAWMDDEYSKLVGHNEFGMITGKPLELWGSEGRFDSTALGGMYVLRELSKLAGIDLKNAKIAIQGFGNAGNFAFSLVKKLFGSRIVAITDSSGGVYSEQGLDYEKLQNTKKQTGTIANYENAEKITNEQLFEIDADIIIPAAIENQITKQNADKIKAKIVLELANGPVTPEANDILFEKNIYDAPDFLVNSGGVIVSYFEWVQNINGYYWTEDEVYKKLDAIMTKSFNDVINTQKKYQDKSRKIDMRSAAYIIALERVAATMKIRGWY
ncbi:MAG: Glu/Leu/Phe/Val dehydrogenase [Candidatus Marsarchaeota archaeon]|nr:Glu/Leu/Phe/Val dehydrogenase [Candidatus Marsarchaeota archaeon]MCL5094785.1 Glu/Leu/Phe/Val dehydrogenase [Candidatus Marsarchaeota archaeon]